MLFNINKLEFDERLCKLFKIPVNALPRILPSASKGYGKFNSGIFSGLLISGVAGDQHASLFGHRCFSKNQAKCTFGTGAFLLVNAGNKPK